MVTMLGIVRVLLVLGVTAFGVNSLEDNLPFKKSCVRDGGCTKTSLDQLEPADVELGRLPDSLWPHHQNLELQPDIYTGEPPFAFSGHTDVWLDCLEETDIVYLNSLSLDIVEGSVEITVAEDSPIQPDPPQWTSFQTDDELQFFTLELQENLVVGARYRLSMAFTGWLRGPSDAFYWDSYEEEGQTIYLVATQFQAHNARTALPCFDEPVFKTTYNTTLVRQEDMLSLSNMEVIDQEDRGEGWVADTYDVTPVMSAYLLCFVICDFVYVETVSNNGHVIRIWARRENIHAADFALQAAADIQDFFEDDTGVPYTLPKNDHIALPSKGGAMENWGLITYGEWNLLSDPTWATSGNVRYTYQIIAHEVAHMWFGNLVTCLWWNHSWLNEGFANYYQYRAFSGDAGWNGGDFMTVEKIHTIMKRDALNTSEAIRVEVDSPWDPATSATSFTYDKGAAVARMLRQIIGEESFRRGITRYLTRHAFGSATTDDLWQAMTEQAAEDGITDTDGSALDFKEKMDPWTDQPGFPLVSLYRDGQQTHAYQWRFLNPADQELNDPSPWDYLYNVPLTYATSDDPDMSLETRVWLDRDNGTVDGLPQGPDDWFVANVELSGFYMVDYDVSNRQALVEQLLEDHQVFTSETRAHLIHDAFVLARIGHHPEEYGFEMTRYLSQEMGYAAWFTAEDQLSYPDLILARYPVTYGHFEAYLRGQVDWVYGQLGWEPESDDEPNEVPSLRMHILSLACKYYNTDCMQESGLQFDGWQQNINNNLITTDQRMTVYCTSLRDGSQADWDFVYQAYELTAQSSHPGANTERNRLLDSMACSLEDTTMQGYLQMTLDGDIDEQDATRAMTAIASTNNVGRDVMWRHLEDNWREPDVMPPGVSKNGVFLSTTDGFATENDLTQLEAFFLSYPAEDQEEQDAYDSALMRVTENNSWADDNVENLDEWLQENTPGGVPVNTGHSGNSGL